MRFPKPAALVLGLLLGVLTLLPGCVRSANETTKPSRGVILFIGDGMGMATVTAARIHKGYLEKKTPPASGVLVLDQAPRGATVRTYAADCMISDSAAGATALACGHKTVNGALSASPRPGGGVDTLTTLLELAESHGLATGLVTTTTITHATPASFYAHTLDRGREVDIALEAIPGPRNPRIGDGVEVLLGGGRDFWIPKGMGTGKREDGRNLIDEMLRAGYAAVDSAAQLEEAVAAGRTKIIGLFSSSHLEYEADRPFRGRHQPTLSQMTRAAIQVLSRNKDGYFLMVEGGRIDHALHFNNAYRAVTDMLEFDRAIGEALKLVGPETLILITADHDHTMVLSGEPAPEADVFSQAGKDMNGKPFTTLIFGNGPTAALAAPDTLTPDTLLAPDFKERSGIPMPYEEHGGQDVPLYAFGPETYLRLITGSMENTDVHDVLRAAMEGK
ncbi:MAG TPA: alkaline phosphatase [Candidatus Eisenbacteria bacterium]|nr:alkaline phosphatase [Candidatus Eisenbacteria bacterium]